MPQEPANSLNPSHERRLGVTCRSVDKLLADMESMLHASGSKLGSTGIYESDSRDARLRLPPVEGSHWKPLLASLFGAKTVDLVGAEPIDRRNGRGVDDFAEDVPGSRRRLVAKNPG